MKIALVGDVHGDLSGLADMLATAESRFGIAAAIQVGDLGFREDLLGAGVHWPRMPVPVHALCGNHEDHAFLGRARSAGLWRHWAESGLVYQPRGSLAKMGGRMCGFLGGAMHVDRPQEPANRPSTSEVKLALQVFAAARPTVIVTHSCPPGIGIGMRASEQFARGVHDYVRRAGIDPGPADDCGEPALERFWQALVTKPALWVFGHFHVFHERMVGNTRFICCPPLDLQDYLLVWDSESGDIHKCILNWQINNRQPEYAGLAPTAP